MDNIMGKPNALKQVNLSLVRKAIKEKGSATRSEIVGSTKISTTTVRTLLTEMLDNKEIIEIGLDDSIGGRKAVRYALVKERFFGVAMCLEEDSIRYLIVNICGEIQEKGTFPVEGNTSKAIYTFLDELVTKIKIRSIGIGVPGVVDGMSYQKKNEEGEVETYSIGEIIRMRYGVPIILENDLNAITLGFGRCYLNEFPEESCENINMAYVYFGKECLSAGFLSGGKILRGWNNYVGELGLFPVGEDQTLGELLLSPIEDHRYAKIVAKLLAGICCILNPQYIAIGGMGFRKHCLSMITEYFDDTLPDKMAAEIVYAEDKWHDYYEGMAYLTADQIFSNVVLVKK